MTAPPPKARTGAPPAKARSSAPPDWWGLGGGAVRPSPPQLATILPTLLVGEYPRLEDLAWLRDMHGITAVVCLQDDADLASKRLRADDLARVCREVGLDWHREPVPDGDAEFLAARLPGLVDRLHDLMSAGACVYLHCNAGYNRAPTVAIAYLHERQGLTLAAASERVKQCRSCVPYVSALTLCYGER